jgi:pimeloyl-ACP methyl ester carboxylesterase
VRVDGVELHYVERGAGVPLIFVHGALDDYRYWTAQMDRFAQHYHVIAYSRRYNFPNHNSLTASDHSGIVEADDLAALIKRLKLGRVDLVGVSYGGYTALLVGARHLELVRSLVLAEPAVLPWADATPQGAAEVAKFMSNVWTPAAAAFRRGDEEGAVRLIIDFFVGPGGFDGAPPALRQSWMDNAPEWRALTTSRNAFPVPPQEQIKRIRVPVLVLCGEKTQPMFKAVVAQVRGLLPQAEEIVVPGATHDMWNEHPEFCGEATLNFLAKH